ncbi:MAG: hypothetical protein FJ304_22205 [Planctomycetes bacterium]|nr:hypothetical protein [Planctomycetota bacterium]
MARPPKDPFKLPDGRETPVTLQKRGNVYRVKFKNPEGKFVVVTTGRTDVAGAWTEAAKIVLHTFKPTEPKPTARTATWDHVIAELANVELRERGLQAYTSKLTLFRSLTSSKGPNDVTGQIAKDFLKALRTTKFTKSKKEGAKEYTRTPNTIASTRRLLLCLWNHLLTLNLATSNPWDEIAPVAVPKLAPTAPTEKDIDQFFEWLDGKGWELLSVFFRVKALACCRTNDLCQVESHQFNPKTRTLTIKPSDDKTNRERIFPLPKDLSNRLNKLKGKTYLWERYCEDSKKYRPGRRNAKEFKPSLMYWAVGVIFPQYREAYPDRPHMTAHDLRGRGITQLVKAHGIDASAKAIGIHPDTARRHYLDAQQAFDTNAIMTQAANVLLPKA